jgi:PIN domain nuclease of toxin-antitoxin system
LILFDTQVLLWLLYGDSRLGRQARQVIDDALADGRAAVSAITFWEVAMLHGKGRITLQADIGSWRESLIEEGLIEIPVDGGIAVRAGLLQDMHGDPADRLIVATALDGHQLVTADRRILDWPGQLSRLRATD